MVIFGFYLLWVIFASVWKSLDGMSWKECYYEDKVLGRILLRRSAKARYVSLRIKGGEVILTLPLWANESSGLSFLRSKYDWIKERLSLSEQSDRRNFVFDEESQFSTLTFDVKIVRAACDDFGFRFTNGLLTVSCPASLDIRLPRYQDIIRMGIERVMRSEAVRVLPARLATFAKQFGFSYKRVSIRSSQSRWGSCSSSGTISLSFYMMLLPEHLVDYVLLHELCHTREMNHSASFWALMREVTGGKSDLWRKEIKEYHTNF